MVTVRSVMTRQHRPRPAGWRGSCGSIALIELTVDHVGAGLALHVDDDPGCCAAVVALKAAHAARRMFSASIDHVAARRECGSGAVL